MGFHILIMNSSPEHQRLAETLTQLVEAIGSLVGKKIEESVKKTAPAASPQRAYEVINPERVLNKQEMAEYLGVSLRTVDNWIHRGQLPHWRIGKCVRFRLGDVVGLLNERNRVSPFDYRR